MTIWDEKPKADLESDMGSYGYYKDPMDAWLEKLKAHYKPMEERDEQLKLVEKHPFSSNPQEAVKIAEATFPLTFSGRYVVSNINQMKDKLEAINEIIQVKNHSIYVGGQGIALDRSFTYALKQLKKILEGE